MPTRPHITHLPPLMEWQATRYPFLAAPVITSYSIHYTKLYDIVGYDVVKARGGEILTIELTEGYSTTALIDRIKGAY